MYCVTNKSPGGKLDYPNSGSGCTIKVPLQDTQYNILWWDYINIFQGHILLFCMTERSNISLKIDIIIFKFVQFCSMGKIERDPPPVLGNFGSAISPFQNQRERLVEC